MMFFIYRTWFQTNSFYKKYKWQKENKKRKILNLTNITIHHLNEQLKK